MIAALAAATLVPGATAGTKRTFLYAHDNGIANRVWGFELTKTGTLEPLPGGPVDTNNSRFDLSGVAGTAAYSAKKKLLFTAGGSGVSAFRVGADGSLTLVEGSPFLPQAEMESVTVAEIGKRTYVYASEPASGVIHLYDVHKDGTLVEVDVEMYVGDAPTGMKVVNNIIYFGRRDGTTAGCKIRKDGTLVPIPGYDLEFAGPVNMVYPDVKGKNLFIKDAATPQFFAFKLAKKRAKEHGQSPYESTVSTTAGLSALAVGAGKHVFALGSLNGEGDVQAFKVTKKGKLKASETTQDSGLTNLKGGAIDPSGRFLVLVDDVNDTLKSFAINKATGALTLVDTETVAFGDDDVNGLVFVKR